ncbi:MICOS complex subunit MIC27 [Salminus brasiliensis]|uniref:MICOS complex subunit MIC27 n=1 Tax=Salminus brasiliensis TaxID=930266 RepID=UPI003B83801B
MAVKVVKLAVLPAALGLASFRVYAMTEQKTDDQISPRELSIYSPEPPVLQYVEEPPGHLQTGLGRVRVGLQPYVRKVQSACTSVKVGVTSVYQTGQDMYEFLRDPSPGFLPRVGIITVSGLAGLILARKGSRLKRISLPLALTTVGAAVCYPTESVGVVKLTGKKMYSASSLVASVFKSKPKEDVVVPHASLEPVTPNKETTASKALLESEPVEVAFREGAITPVAEVAPEPDDARENGTAFSEGQTVIPQEDVPQEGSTVSEFFPVAPAEIVHHVEDSQKADLASAPEFAQEEAIPVDIIPKTETVIAAEVTAITILPEITSSEVGGDLTVAEVAPTEVVEIFPVAEAAPHPDQVPEEVATVSELALIVEGSSEVEVTLLPDVAPEEVTPTAADVEIDVVVETPVKMAAVDEALSASATLLTDPALEVAPKRDLETEATHESECATDCANLNPEPVAEAALVAIDSAVSVLPPTEKEATPLAPLPAEEPMDFVSPELHPDNIPLSPPPSVVEEPSSLPPLSEETTFCPSATDEITSVPPVIDQPTLIAEMAVQETTSSSPAVEITPPAFAEGQTTHPPSATEVTTSPLSDVDEAIPPAPAVEETTSPATGEQIPALNSASVKEKPRFVPDPSLLDHGQAHPEDADMYSTRG